jgi:hypothetical protein
MPPKLLFLDAPDATLLPGVANYPVELKQTAQAIDLPGLFLLAGYVMTFLRNSPTTQKHQ